ncbi:MAG: hypothetical protein Tsb0034_19800 [Ekhidna sp.]
MKIVFHISLVILSFSVQAQNITFGSSTTFTLGSEATFYAGGNTYFNGEFSSDGTIISFSDLDFIANDTVGSLRFVGAGDQELFGDTLYITNMEVNKSGNVKVSTDRIFVSGNLNVTSGVIQTDDIDDLIVTGQSNPGRGYVEGKLVGLTSGRPVTFPMGINGFANYVTFSNTTAGITMIVDCVVPDPTTLLPTEDMVGIADEVEWIVRTVEGETEAQVAVDFAGLDFINFSNGQSVRANKYAPAVVMIQKEDTIYTALESVEATPEDNASNQTSGRVVSNTTITIDTTATRINVAWLPIVDGPQFYVPNAFSPNGFYEENRVFRPFYANGEITSIQVSVFNSFNEEVYSYNESGTDLDLSLVGWDGSIGSGNEAEAGVYYYRIQLVADAQVYQKTGSVLLVK